VVLARTGNVSFGQGLFFAAGGYGVALIANAWGLTDAVAQVMIGAVCGGLLGLVIGPLIARYSGIFFGMLTLALVDGCCMARWSSRPRSAAPTVSMSDGQACSEWSSPIRAMRISCSMRSR